MKPTALAKEAGVSVSYASQILTGERSPSRPLAIHIFRKTGWRHPLLDGLSEEQMAVLESIEPWAPRKVSTDAPSSSQSEAA
ncbi:helix-turn-helix transcriptional regulator [Sphingobium sp.]|uniref:helix-turn-helix transcriptional regulator n=1 Tax=Sphingobium sp. TaxID=1912891 RepID=UPI002C8C854A|nr:helix-turn-helix transcriptional regulator [Sphingobium sp.]HUD92311.1 helix-turn-helix transcriptional regulator [Sphingobium sp.]